MSTTREKIEQETHKSSESRFLNNILIRAYHANLEYVYDTLVKLPDDKDRLRLLKYIDKKPFLSSETIRRMVDTYRFYRVTLKTNEKFRHIYMSNNLRLLTQTREEALAAKHINQYASKKKLAEQRVQQKEH